MCLGAIYWARPTAVYYGNTKVDAAKIGFHDQFIYGELILPLDKRNLKTTQLLGSEAIKAFEMWVENSEKTEY
jgi:tRNA(Arg) A34 adenosine deaminase TadA